MSRGLARERLRDVTVYLHEHCPYWAWSVGEDLLHRLDDIRPPGECGDEWDE